MRKQIDNRANVLICSVAIVAMAAINEWIGVILLTICGIVLALSHGKQNDNGST